MLYWFSLRYKELKLTCSSSTTDENNTPTQESVALEPDMSVFVSGIDCLSLAARFFQLPVNTHQLKREFTSNDEQLAEINILRAAKFIGLKAKVCRLSTAQLANVALPAMALHKDGHFFLIVKSKRFDEKVEFLVHDVKQGKPAVFNDLQLAEICQGKVILLTKRTTLINAKSKFGFSWFLPAIVKYKKFLTDVIIASFFIQFLGLASPIFFQVVIDKVLVHRGLTTLDVLAIGFFVVITFEVLLTGFRTYLFSHTTNRIDVELGSSLYKHLLSLPLSYFANSRVGQTVARVKELENIRNFITGTSLTLALDVVFSLLFIAFMFFYSPLLTWIIVGTIPCYIILSLIITPTLRKRLEEQFQRSAENHSFLVESISGAETIKSLAIEPQLRNQWDERLADYVTTSFKASNINNVYSQIASYINKVSSLLTLYFGALAVVTGALTVGQFIAFNMLAQRVSGPIMRLVNLWQEFQQANISLNRLGDILNLPTEPGYNPNRASLPQLEGNVTFEHVSFRYHPKASPVLNDISLNTKAGEVIGIVGFSGSGKSTLTKLIQRLYVPESGKVKVDGIDLALVDPAWLRQQVGVVLQENFLFNRSVRDNIALADPGADIENVIAVSKLAGAHEFILELSEGYDSMVGEHGSSLSGGQKQRIAIARALLTNPKILIFDEATSALDYESENIIQQNMRHITKGRTVFIIAHRLTAVRQANRILVMDKGRIAEHGSHDNLVASRGIYHKLYALQSSQSSTDKKAVPAIAS
ncbi:MAG: subfamily B ATP-binding cassette protein HlyB/CyaB [Oleiphilaceae bacterium]|jgi:subfamily B ATP-binding cassette protein HlyB/CyaB